MLRLPRYRIEVVRHSTEKFCETHVGIEDDPRVNPARSLPFGVVAIELSDVVCQDRAIALSGIRELIIVADVLVRAARGMCALSVVAASRELDGQFGINQFIGEEFNPQPGYL